MSEPALVYCKHMDMDVYEGSCAMCTPPELERVSGQLMARTQAQFETGCDACDRRIQIDDDIALVDGVWVHAEHWEQP